MIFGGELYETLETHSVAIPSQSHIDWIGLDDVDVDDGETRHTNHVAIYIFIPGHQTRQISQSEIERPKCQQPYQLLFIIVTVIADH